MKKKIYPAKFRKRKARVKDSSKPLLKKKKIGQRVQWNRIQNPKIDHEARRNLIYNKVEILNHWR